VTGHTGETGVLVKTYAIRYLSNPALTTVNSNSDVSFATPYGVDELSTNIVTSTATTVTIPLTGVYRVTYTVNIDSSSATAGTFTITKNGVAVPAMVGSTRTGEIHSVTMSALVSVTSGQTLSLRNTSPGGVTLVGNTGGNVAALMTVEMVANVLGPV